MTLAELVVAARTCRRFKGSMGLPSGVLGDLVDLARFCPSARNAQPLRYALISDSEARETMFSLVTFGAALKPEQRATAQQHPGAYIVILAPLDLSAMGLMDVGIAAQTINLAATAAGLACCMIGAFSKPGVINLLGTPAELEPKLVLALGAPDEERQITTLGPDGNTSYFHDDHDVHWVPKRSLEDVVITRL